MDLTEFIGDFIQREVAQADGVTAYRAPLVGFASAADPRFREIQRVVEPTHFLPEDMLPGARTVVSFFLPFDARVVEANAEDRYRVAREWSVAYVETNALIGRIASRLSEALANQGVRSAVIPATHNFDPESLVCRWSHKSVAVIAGLGSLGLHRMVITDFGCAGRFGSLIIDADLRFTPPLAKERCLYYHDGTCWECVTRCPVKALELDGVLDKKRCQQHLDDLGKGLYANEVADACGKCAIGPCSLESAVH